MSRSRNAKIEARQWRHIEAKDFKQHPGLCRFSAKALAKMAKKQERQARRQDQLTPSLGELAVESA